MSRSIDQESEGDTYIDLGPGIASDAASRGRAGSRGGDEDSKADRPRPRMSIHVSATEDSKHTLLGPSARKKGSDDVKDYLSVYSRATKAASLEVELTPRNKSEVRYTPVLCRDPRQFVEKGYKVGFHNIKVFIVVTMYNEQPDEVRLTLRGICENLNAFQDKLADDKFWKQVAVCIVSDGRERANRNTLKFLEDDLGFYNGDLVAQALRNNDEREIGCHLFEGTVIFNEYIEEETKKLEDESLSKKGNNTFPPLQLMFALKEHNAGKIDSHWWFFEAFGNSLKPDYCFLLDVGTRPRKGSFIRLYNSFERNPQIAGTCGEITTRNLANLSFLVSGQHFEYKIAGILDKAMESIFGYISVLPGAFSAYRFDALLGNPLRQYFKHIEQHTQGVTSPFEANMYLAEDRILCFELFAKAGFDYSLHFIKDAGAETDVPDDIVALIKQRRRWLNGSFFAMLYAIRNYPRILKESSHTWFRKISVSFLFLYYTLQVFVTWFLVGAFYLTIYATVDMATDSETVIYLVTGFYALLILGQTLFALADKPNHHTLLYSLVYVIQGLFFLWVFAYIVYYTVSNVSSSTTLAVGFCLSLVIYVVATFIYGEMMSLFSSFIQYIFLVPTFMVTFPIYSFSNVHDISWGTKDLDTVQAKADHKKKEDGEALLDEAERKKQAAQQKAAAEAMYFSFRSYLMFFWLFSNCLLVSLITKLDETENFLTVLLYAIIFFNGTRLLGSMIYIVLFAWTRRREQVIISEAIKERGDEQQIASHKLKPWWRFPLEFFFAFVFPRAYVAIFMELIVSPIFLVLAILWIMCSAVFSIVSLCDQRIAIFAFKSWRFLARIEFSWFSYDGRVARILKIDSITKKHAARICMESSLPEDKGITDYYADENTFRPVFYFTISRVLFTAFALVAILGFLDLSVLFLAHDSLASACSSSSLTICTYITDFYDTTVISSIVASSWTYVVGAICVLLFFNVAIFVDSIHRKLASNSLGDSFSSLKLDRLRALGSKTEYVGDTIVLNDDDIRSVLSIRE